MKYVPPSPELSAFNCPYCRAYAHQRWFVGGLRSIPAPVSPAVLQVHARLGNPKNPPTIRGPEDKLFYHSLSGCSMSECANCNAVTIWVNDAIVYPQTGDSLPPNPDMPLDIRRDYDEASAILDKSPRGAAALIRLAIQKLCIELGQPGRNINHDIAALVKGGLDPRVQRALDAVRVIGNNAVHPGKIDIRDDRATAETLFKLLNLIVDKTISEPKHVDEVYASLPEGAVKAIEKRGGCGNLNSQDKWIFRAMAA